MGVDDGVAEQVYAALRAELAMLPPTAAVPALLTRDETRRRLAECVRQEFPQTTVVSYGDLPPDCNVQPVARIGSG
jgi:flagellar biosynthesis component FlhA